VIAYLRGNLLEDEAQALVNTVNTVGVMGKGMCSLRIAFQVRATRLRTNKWRMA
jgi:hypothetical protein